VTEPVGDDADDPAIWRNSRNPAASLLLGTNKAAAPNGALVVFDLNGRIRQIVSGLDRPNNVDVEYGLQLGEELVDVAVVTERNRGTLRVYKIPANGAPLVDISATGGLDVFEGEKGLLGAPMGIGLYRRARDGAVYAVVSRKAGPTQGYLWQYRLEDDGQRRVVATKVRELGRASINAEIEAVAVDDALGYVYYAEEALGIHKWHADPDHPKAGRELSVFGRSGFYGDREGIAIYSRTAHTGFIVVADQIKGRSRYLVFRREGGRRSPHDHSETVRIIDRGADDTDGLDAAAFQFGSSFPRGFLVAMNSRDRNFLVYRWEDLSLH
jgi:3-phytase